MTKERLAPMVGEITELGFNMLGDQLGADFKDLDINSANIPDKEAGAHELADVLCYSVLLADRYGLDLDTIIREKIKRNEEKYPVSASYGNKSKYTELKKGSKENY